MILIPQTECDNACVIAQDRLPCLVVASNRSAFDAFELEVQRLLLWLNLANLLPPGLLWSQHLINLDHFLNRVPLLLLLPLLELLDCSLAGGFLLLVGLLHDILAALALALSLLA